MITIYGISNCDTVKKSRRHLEQNNIDYHFHDFRKDGLNDALLKQLLASFSPEFLINRRGTTWRQLTPEQQQTIMDPRVAAGLLAQYPAIIRRPVIRDANNEWRIGFDSLTALTTPS
ncbi:ArsC family reductase [Pseudohongiella sp. SYSU M77423]|uniref:ArsC family reductase n=1 Tax=Pseudohongiella sp. SYSU M77423 TaxID=3042312 RepID=UPI002480FF56|nr:ArsC family reductase [Pseudohongiella sp. SYSU M77423]MDH7943075.1 ArsC family reductase [Pseudohongiella sp. SYSU M77423]